MSENPISSARIRTMLGRDGFAARTGTNAAISAIAAAAKKQAGFTTVPFSELPESGESCFQFRELCLRLLYKLRRSLGDIPFIRQPAFQRGDILRQLLTPLLVPLLLGVGIDQPFDINIAVV